MATGATGLPPVAAGLAAGVCVGAATLEQGACFVPPPLSGPLRLPDCPQSDCADCSCAAIAAATSLHGSNTALTHIASQANMNQPAQRLAARVDIGWKLCRAE